MKKWGLRWAKAHKRPTPHMVYERKETKKKNDK